MDGFSQGHQLSNTEENYLKGNGVLDFLPSREGAGARVIKNWLPFVLGPAFAMEKMPAPVCFNSEFISSSKCLLQYITKGNQNLKVDCTRKTEGLIKVPVFCHNLFFFLFVLYPPFVSRE